MPETPETLTEALSEAAHDAWMDAKRSQGVTSRPSEWGEELMVPYAALSEQAKDLDRSTVRGVLAAIDRAGYVVAPTDHDAMARANALVEVRTEFASLRNEIRDGERVGNLGACLWALGVMDGIAARRDLP
jgi:hypothetical protein